MFVGAEYSVFAALDGRLVGLTAFERGNTHLTGALLQFGSNSTADIAAALDRREKEQEAWGLDVEC